MNNTAHQVLNTFLSNNMDDFLFLYDQNDTQIIRHKIYDDILIKVSNKTKKDSDFQMNLLNNLPTSITNMSRILYNQTFNQSGENKTLEVITFMPGQKRDTYTSLQVEKVIITLKHIHEALNSIESSQTDSVACLKDIFYGLTASVQNIAIKKIIEKLFELSEFQDYMALDDRYLIIADLVSENILFNDHNCSFIDLDPIIMGPKNLQIAILLSSNILIQKDKMTNLSINYIENLYHIWGVKTVRKSDIIALTVFPLLMLIMRQVDYDNIAEDDDSLYYRLKVLLEFLLVHLFS